MPLRILSLLISAVLFLSCGYDRDNNRTPRPTEDPDKAFALSNGNTRWWIDKVARTLHLGKGVNQSDQFSLLESLSPGEVIDTFMEDDRFYDTVLDFNMHFLGVKNDKVGFPNPDMELTFYSNILGFAHALDGAERIMKGEDYFGFITTTPRTYAKPLSPIFNFDEETMEFSFDKDSEGTRKKLYVQFQAFLGEAVNQITDDMSASDFCSLLRNKYYELGLDYRFFSLIFDPEFGYAGPHSFCLNFVAPIDREKAERATAKLINWFRTVTDYLSTLEPSRYLPTSIKDVKRYDTSIIPKNSSLLADGMNWFWFALTNSSTNFNRKRASYILKRFFCDDLTPINVVLPEDHAKGDIHGTDPGCQACHYKLDPIAGFFRNHGGFGTLYESDSISFDDGAVTNLEDYTSHWKSKSSERTWDIGYIRSTTDESLNDYSANPDNPSLDDLFAMMRRLPEVKRCVVDRMVDYYIGPAQTLDAGFVAALQDSFIELSKESTTRAFKETTKSILLSKTFQHMDPEYDQCYDYAEGTDMNSRPPCKVAHIIEKNCLSCHSDTNAQGGLNVAKWKQIEPGKMGFAHLDADTKQISPEDTFARIGERLNSRDEKLRMPLSKHMDSAEREVLYLWSLSQNKGE